MTKRQFARMAAFTMCVAVLLPFDLMPEARGFNGPDLLTQQIRATEIKGKTLVEALDTLTSDYGIPIGIELEYEKSRPAVARSI